MDFDDFDILEDVFDIVPLPLWVAVVLLAFCGAVFVADYQSEKACKVKTCEVGVPVYRTFDCRCQTKP